VLVIKPLRLASVERFKGSKVQGNITGGKFHVSRILETWK